MLNLTGLLERILRFATFFSEVQILKCRSPIVESHASVHSSITEELHQANRKIGVFISYSPDQ